MKNFHSHIQKINIRDGVETILRTLNEPNRNLGVTELCRILKGDTRLALEGTEPTRYEPNGRLADHHFQRILNLVNYLQTQEYLKAPESDNGALRLSLKGVAFLQKPSDLMVSTRELSLSSFDKALRNSLLQLRQGLCETENLPPFRVYTDYTIQKIVQDRPQDLPELRRIPGIGAFKAEKYGEKILKLVQKINHQQNQLTT